MLLQINLIKFYLMQKRDDKKTYRRANIISGNQLSQSRAVILVK